MRTSEIQDREGKAFERKCSLIGDIESKLGLDCYSLGGLLTVNITQLERLHDKIIEMKRHIKDYYKIKLTCTKCGKNFQAEILKGVKAEEANLPHGVYLHNEKGYYTLEGELSDSAEYIKCRKCNSENVRLI